MFHSVRIRLFVHLGFEFPFEWVQEFNTYLDGITVMSSQVKKIIIDNGVSIPIEVCHLGVDHIDLNQQEEEVIFDKDVYKFLHISSCFPRSATP